MRTIVKSKYEKYEKMILDLKDGGITFIERDTREPFIITSPSVYIESKSRPGYSHYTDCLAVSMTTGEDKVFEPRQYVYAIDIMITF